MASTTSGLHPDLASVHEQIGRLIDDVRQATSGLTYAQFNWRPEPGKWSIAENIAHMTRVASVYLPHIDAAIQDGHKRGVTGPGPYKYGWFGNLFVKMSEPPPKQKFKAPRAMQPPVESRLDIVQDFEEMHRKLQRTVESANGLDLGRVSVRSPITPLIRFTLGQSLQVMAGHGRRHLWHCNQVRSNAHFPA
jgi:hypothetical protein